MPEPLNQLILGANFNYDILHSDKISKPAKPANLYKRVRIKQYLIDGIPMKIAEAAKHFKLGMTQTYTRMSDLKCPQRVVYRDIMKDGSIVDTVASGWVK